MHNIYYIDEEALGHLSGDKTINSLLWKLLYKRVEKRLKNSIINIENIRKIAFNKHNLTLCNIKGDLPYVFLNNNPSIYYAEDEKEYFIPLNICFTNGKQKYNVVLVDGKIDIRDDSKKGDDINKKLLHSPVLLLKVFNNIEKSFEILLNYIQNVDNK